ncbi:ribosomal protein S18-alanine N-acetyltransferase [Sanguibacter suaedae]|uniref:Ribosomal protein S18-alanine N-acetyltransferase n=1 Tax=Sanguibacter suaedae TaxID=2795737 RepID=A0A934MAC5_9MICO|nr:ribosomal protein S18-alanine N-acetyltransferase [Sanguibacter suaedae]MBI9114086.1 ribosomal protein S18-alanine N-acetyltransferase [Sanguibacter suaedae]
MTAPTTGGRAPALLRPLSTEDLDVVARLEVELFGRGAWSPAMLEEELRAPGRWYVAAVDDASDPPVLVGYAGLWFDGDDAQVMTLGVAPGARRRGVGALMLRALVGRALALGARSVLLEVAVDNDAAVALYERSGFVRFGLRRRYYQPEGTDAHTMRLDLAHASAPEAVPTDGPETA